MKEFNRMTNVGRARYVINFHDGVKAHKDGSRFFDTRIFTNKVKRNAFIKELRKSGYIET